MTWTYNETLTSDRDRVRMLVGDVDRNDQQLADEALDWHLTEEGGIYAAASAACRSLAATYARRVDFGNSTLSLAASQRIAHYNTMAERYERRARTGSVGPGAIGAPIVGGLTIDDIQAVRGDANAIQNRMRHDMHEAPNDDAPPDVVSP
jgi:hypothetical protein